MPPIAASALWGSVNSGAPVFEQFSIGGGPSTILDRAAARAANHDARASERHQHRLVGRDLSRRPRHGADVAVLLGGQHEPRANDRYDNWHRVIGLDWTMSVGAIAPAGTPAARAQFGIGESLDEPFRKRVRAYASLILNP